jgi:hypothetical protein
VSCNPPPPRDLDCPADKRGPNSKVLPQHDQRPPGKAGWLRFHEKFWAGAEACSYSGDQLCPPPGTQGSCVGGESIEFPCPAEGGPRAARTIPGFKAERAAGGCVGYPEFQCEPAGCTLPAPIFMACNEPVPQPPAKTQQAGVFRGRVTVDATGCRLMVSPSCPPGATCNPPPPMLIDCPPDKRAPGTAAAVDDARPPDKAGWLRVRPALYVSEQGCRYEVDRFCPAPDSAGHCDDYQSAVVPCQAPGAGPKAPPGKQGFLHVPAFQAPRAAGGCFDYPALWCAPQRNCDLPKGRVGACQATLAR